MRDSAQDCFRLRPPLFCCLSQAKKRLAGIYPRRAVLIRAIATDGRQSSIDPDGSPPSRHPVLNPRLRPSIKNRRKMPFQPAPKAAVKAFTALLLLLSEAQVGCTIWPSFLARVRPYALFLLFNASDPTHQNAFYYLLPRPPPPLPAGLASRPALHSRQPQVAHNQAITCPAGQWAANDIFVNTGAITCRCVSGSADPCFQTGRGNSVADRAGELQDTCTNSSCAPASPGAFNSDAQLSERECPAHRPQLCTSESAPLAAAVGPSLFFSLFSLLVSGGVRGLGFPCSVSDSVSDRTLAR